MIRTEWECPQCHRKIQVDMTREEADRIREIACPVCAPVGLGIQLMCRWVAESSQQIIKEHATHVWNDSRLARGDVKKVAQLIFKKLKES